MTANSYAPSECEQGKISQTLFPVVCSGTTETQGRCAKRRGVRTPSNTAYTNLGYAFVENAIVSIPPMLM